jgi:hypothetical protein
VPDVKPRREEYVIRYCAADGCDVRIREHIEQPGHPLCRWCQEREQGKGFPHESYAKKFEMVKQLFRRKGQAA